MQCVDRSRQRVKADFEDFVDFGAVKLLAGNSVDNIDHLSSLCQPDLQTPESPKKYNISIEGLKRAHIRSKI